MNKFAAKSLLLSMTATLAVSCGTSKSSDNSQQATKFDTNDSFDTEYLYLSDAQRDMVKKNNVFALNLFKQVSGADSKVISPLSVTYLMGMLSNGADGDTQSEIIKTIGWGNVALSDINSFSKMLMESYPKLDRATTISIANYVAVNNQYKLLTDFQKTVETNYKAEVESLDFASGKTLGRINSWCSKHTDGMIPKIIDNVEPSALSYIMNAIYFNGTWSDKFEKSMTKQENFKGYTRDIKKAYMMHRTDELLYVSNDSFSAVRIPYGNGTFTMTVVLPNADKSISDVLGAMDAEKLSAIRYSMENCRVDLKLPRFTTTTELPLNDIIASLGAPSMFSPGKADFSKLAEGSFFISKMFQKAKIEVSEEGTKAAAVTAAIAMATSLNAPEPRFVKLYADRPFIYMITDNAGNILFMGQYTGDDL